MDKMLKIFLVIIFFALIIFGGIYSKKRGFFNKLNGEKKMTVGVIGLGRMGESIAYRLADARINVFGYDPSPELKVQINSHFFQRVSNLKDLVTNSKIIWLMVPAGDTVDKVINDILPYLTPDNIIIDGGNSFFKDSIRRYNFLREHKISFLDCGTSGGLHGKECGFCLMVGGDKEAYDKCKEVFDAISWSQKNVDKCGCCCSEKSDKELSKHECCTEKNKCSCSKDQDNCKNKECGCCCHSSIKMDGKFSAYVGPAGAGHYVKMVHNGIEYALLEAYSEGFHLLKSGTYENLNLEQISRIWNNGSIIRSWLLKLSNDVFKKDQEFKDISGVIEETGTGRWTADEAKAKKIPVDLIERAVEIRAESRKTGGNYANKIVALLRNAFGGHAFKKLDKNI